MKAKEVAVIRGKIHRFLRRIRLLLRFVGMLIAMGARRVTRSVKHIVRRAVDACRRLPHPSLSKIKGALRHAWNAVRVFFQALITGIKGLKASKKEKKTAGQGETQSKGNERPIDPMQALIPVSADAQEERERRAVPPPLRAILASTGRFSHHRVMRYVQRGMVACGVGVAVCMLLLLLLFVIRVREVRVEGASYYEETEILSCVEVQPGDELFAFSASALERKLTDQFSYLRSATVKRRGGTVVISLEEYRPVWALIQSDGRAALLDESYYVPELCEADRIPQDVCLLYMSLPLIAGEDEQGEVAWLEQRLEAGDRIQGSSAALRLLTELTRSLEQAELPAAPAVLDLTDPYAVTMTLSDGTILYLYECEDPARCLRVAVNAIKVYRSSHVIREEQEILTVYVDGFFRAVVRKMAKSGQ